MNLAVEKIDLKNIAIIDAFPIYNHEHIVLNVGCGEGEIDFYLQELGYKVYATDLKKSNTWQNIEKGDGFVKFSEANLFDLSSFPIKNASIVICSQVLEHLKEYKKAIKNLLELTTVRLIITIPFQRSFFDDAPPPEGHCNFWNDHRKLKRVKWFKFCLYKNIHEFHNLCHPYSVSISKIITKLADIKKKRYDYLIIIDKRQNLFYE